MKATVRDQSNEKNVDHLLRMGAEFPGTLELFQADLLENGSFEEAMTECELVIHNASPFKMFGIKDPQKELIEPALEGTRNVLHTANRTKSVKRIVLTSSIAAVFGDAVDIRSSPNATLKRRIGILPAAHIIAPMRIPKRWPKWRPGI